MVKSNEIPASLNEILFDVELKENPRNTNSAHAYVVTGYGKFNVSTPMLDKYGKKVVRKNATVTINEIVEELDINYCSDYYELVPNVEIFPVIRQTLIDHDIEFIESYSHIDNARFYAHFRITDERYAFYVGHSTDKVQPVINVQHSYNGQTKYRIQFGYFRLICSNGVTIAVEEMKEYNLSIVGRHTKSILRSLEQLNDTLTYFVNNADQIKLAVTAKYNTLAGNWVENWNDRVTEVLNTNKIIIVETKKGNNTLQYIKEVIDSEKHLYDNKINDWLIYNAINRYINDDTINIKAPEIRAELDSKVFESMLS